MRQEPNARRLRRNPRTTRSWADGALDGVVVEFDAAVFDEARQALPARQGVSDGLGKLAFLADQTEFYAQPRLERGDHRAMRRLA